MSSRKLRGQRKSQFQTDPLPIFPLYYSALLVAFVLYLCGAPLLPLAGEWKYYVLYISNWRPVESLNRTEIVGHFWSLAIEEQFYLIWPLCVRLVPHRYLSGLALVLSGVAAALRCFVTFQGPPVIAYVNTLCRMDGLLLGAFGALMVRDKERLRRANLRGFLLVALAGVTLSFPFATNESAFTIGIPSLSLTVLVVIAQSVRAGDQTSRLSRILSDRWLVFLGKYSYGLYVIHFPLFLYFAWLTGRALTPLSSALASVLLILATVSAAWLSYRWLEGPFLSLKDRMTR